MFATATNYIFRKIKTEVCIYPTIYLLRLEASYFSFSLLVVSMINKNCDFKMWISDLPEFVFEHPDLIFVIGIGQLRGFTPLFIVLGFSNGLGFFKPEHAHEGYSLKAGCRA